MRYELHVDPTRRLCWTRVAGEVTLADFLAHATELRAHPDFRPEFSQLVDFREVTEVRVTGADIRRLARENPFAARARRAFVMPRADAFGLARLYSAHIGADSTTFLVTRDIDEACAWLGVACPAALRTPPAA